MNEKQKTKISKFLSLVLRHKPETIDLHLDENGWAETHLLLERLNAKGYSLNRDILKTIVETNDKKRFIFSPDFSKIRANQGHSLKVNLELTEKTPPDILYHGTADKNLNSIMEKGLIKGQRHHVHLSEDKITAFKVGQRYGKPVILSIDAAAMHERGIKFYRSENGVWLVEMVAVNEIKPLVSN